MERSQAIRLGSLWQNGSGKVYVVLSVLGFPRLGFVRYREMGIRGGPEWTLDRKAFLNRFTVMEVQR